MGIATDFIWLPEGLTRINVKIKAGQETEINGMGPAIPASLPDAELEDCARQLQARGATGSATAFSDGLATKEQVMALLNEF